MKGGAGSQAILADDAGSIQLAQPNSHLPVLDRLENEQGLHDLSP
jgi:hypothetical protein